MQFREKMVTFSATLLMIIHTSKTECIGYLGGTDDEGRPADTDAPAKTEHIGNIGGTDEDRPVDADTDTPRMEEEDR